MRLAVVDSGHAPDEAAMLNQIHKHTNREHDEVENDVEVADLCEGQEEQWCGKPAQYRDAKFHLDEATSERFFNVA